jgi:carboxymethylenebutenolidase
VYIATPEMGAGPGLVVIPARRDGARAASELCDSFATEGFTALALELENGQTADELVAAIDLLKPHPAVRGQGVGVIGYDVGAALALWLGTNRPDDVAAVVACDGLLPAGGEQPDWSRLSAAVQGHFAENDPACPPAAIAALEEALGDAGVSVEMFTYPVDDHGRQAWIRTLEFLRKHLG